MSFRSLTLLASIALMLSACALVDPVDTRYDIVGRSLAKARNEAIFLNLVRASHDYPLSFTAIANVTPVTTNTTSFALPSFLIGPQFKGTLPIPNRDVVFGNTTASNNTTLSTNFSISTQETAGFYEGFLKPIDLTTLDYFIRQDYPRELLFWLFADSFEFGPPGFKAVQYRYSPPVSYGCPQNPKDPRQLCFKEWILIAVLLGLTVEEQTISSAQAQASKGKSSSGSAGGASGDPSIIVPRFCFSPVLAQQAANEIGNATANEIKRKYMPFRAELVRPICGTPWEAQSEAKKAQPDTFVLKAGPHQFRIVPRSAYGLFEFLGNLMKIEREHLPPSANAYVPRASEITPPRLLTTGDPNLITVLQAGGPYCFSHTWFFDGDYCVPEQSTNTKRIFSLLAQLIAIQTAATDLSITPLVRIVQ